MPVFMTRSGIITSSMSRDATDSKSPSCRWRHPSTASLSRMKLWRTCRSDLKSSTVTRGERERPKSGTERSDGIAIKPLRTNANLTREPIPMWGGVWGYPNEIGQDLLTLKKSSSDVIQPLQFFSGSNDKAA